MCKFSTPLSVVCHIFFLSYIFNSVMILYFFFQFGKCFNRVLCRWYETIYRIFIRNTKNSSFFKLICESNFRPSVYFCFMREHFYLFVSFFFWMESYAKYPHITSVFLCIHIIKINFVVLTRKSNNLPVDAREKNISCHFYIRIYLYGTFRSCKLFINGDSHVNEILTSI